MTLSKFLYLVLGLVFLILLSKIEVPIGTGNQMLTISGQSLAVILIGVHFGSRYGLIILLAYLLLAIGGLPVLSTGRTGWDVVQSVSTGFLLGFLFSVYICGKLSDRWFSGWFRAIGLHLIGIVIILGFGLIGMLLMNFGLSDLAGLIRELWPGMLIKLILGGLISYGISRLNGRFIFPFAG